MFYKGIQKLKKGRCRAVFNFEDLLNKNLRRAEFVEKPNLLALKKLIN